ncbi:hypothetical protein Q7O_003439 [Pectobacterium carotovorum subsp. carotovorum PCCS1]|nr:hypothetical protein [Pectobacterium carotovorum subsp. carotovorum PCCS1]
MREAVYPRWRGEHYSCHVDVTVPSGLSPLARGTLYSTSRPSAGSRFIPAGAGNTLLHDLRNRCWTVYPRWRGEHITLLAFRHLGRGLSPLARGTRPNKDPVIVNVRFIPAGAGNTDSSPVINTKSAGLSPLARGTPAGYYPQHDMARFIPAGAGNTSGSSQ